MAELLEAKEFDSAWQDLSGRPHCSCGLDIPTERVGTYDTQVRTLSSSLPCRPSVCSRVN